MNRPRLRPDRPSVSVVVPSYNYAHYLEGCVHSIVSQPGVEVEVLIIDDCSQDDTPAVATRLAENDTRITFRRHATEPRSHRDVQRGIAMGVG